MAMPPNFNRPPPNFAMPPVPRDAQEASFSEIIPLRSKKINFLKSPVLWVTAVAGLVSILGFGLNNSFLNANGNPQQQIETFKTIAVVSTGSLLLAITSGFYFYARPNKPYWVFILAAAIVFFGLISKIFFVLENFTADFNPEQGRGNILYATLGPGVREEFFKGIPMLLGALLSFQAMRNPQMLQQSWVRWLRITGPLDGVVMGIFAGAGFTFMETGFQYVLKMTSDVVHAGGSLQLGFASGMALLVPRVVEGLTGHSGYSAIFGYFIGLAVIRPKSKWMLLGIGFATAAVIHGAWDSIATTTPLMIITSAATGLMAIGALLKARQLETVITGRAAETSGSIVVERPIPAMPVGPYSPAGYPQRPAQPPYGTPPQQPYGGPPQARPPYGAPPQQMPYGAPPQQQPQAYNPPPAQPPQGHQPPFQGPPGAAPAYPHQPVAPPPFAGPPAAPAAAPGASLPAGPLTLDVGGVKLPLAAGEIDLGAHSELGGRGAGVKGVVVPHPARPGVFGLRNTGAAAWTATLRDGSTQVIEGDKNIRLAPGVRIDFGGGLTGAVVQG